MGKGKKAGLSYPVYARCSKCDTIACILPNLECVECIFKAGREEKIDETNAYWYHDLCDGVKYYVTLEQT